MDFYVLKPLLSQPEDEELFPPFQEAWDPDKDLPPHYARRKLRAAEKYYELRVPLYGPRRAKEQARKLRENNKETDPRRRTWEELARSLGLKP